MYSLSAGHCPERVFGPQAPRDAAMRALSPCNCNCLPLLQLTNVHHCVLGAPDQCRCVIFFCNNVQQCAMCNVSPLSPCNCNCLPLLQLKKVHHCELGEPQKSR